MSCLQSSERAIERNLNFSKNRPLLCFRPVGSACILFERNKVSKSINSFLGEQSKDS